MKCFLMIAALMLLALYGNATFRIVAEKEIMTKAKSVSIDKMGNIYLVTSSNELKRYNEKGDSTLFSYNVSYGELKEVVTINPLRPVLYYPSLSKIVVLDKMLSIKNEISIRDLGFQSCNTIGGSIDGKFWLYDIAQARLKKLDEQLNVSIQSNDLRQEIGVVPNISYIVESDWKVLLCDSTQGIFVFDMQGNYINTLSIYAKKIQVMGGQIVYVKNDSLFSWDKFKMNQSLLPLPKTNKPILDAVIQEKELLVLYEDKLVMYRVTKEE